ncbi:MAG TPA: sigma-54 dependent transcriptional regulator [Acidobacteriaceae bacterium]|nr:sigma-54 dependent transcriptional regulator [Acidobacteriaceae bacterium]
MRPLRVLVAQNHPDSARSFDSLFTRERVIVEYASSANGCIRLLERRAPGYDLILVDEHLPDFGGIEAIKQIRATRREVPTALMSARLSPKILHDATQAGSVGFLTKPIRTADLEELLTTLCPGQADSVAEAPPAMHIEDLGAGQFFLAAAPAMLEILHQVRMISRTDVPVLITGESGVGKEIVASLIHKYSLRSHRTFLKVNCAALPNDLLESELFGYEAGAFTGAARAKPGKFDVCDKGTILLDEIGEMSPQLQAKLLHVLQDGTFSRLGSRLNTKVDVRVLAATNIDIEQAIAEKRFREDLYYRLNAFVLRVPPLRERTEEIPWLLENLSGKLAVSNGLEPIQFSQRMVAAAVRYHWPGNLRELGNFVKRYLIMRDETAALVELESKVIARPPALSLANPAASGVIAPAAAGLKSAVRSNRDQMESRIIRDVLEESRWNRRIAAERLQISYKSLLQKIRYYNLEASA